MLTTEPTASPMVPESLY